MMKKITNTRALIYTAVQIKNNAKSSSSYLITMR